jgi:hypothetical protein
LGKPAQPMLPILPILPKKMVFFEKMLSNSIKNASDPARLPFSPPRAIREPQTRPHRWAHRVGAGSSGSVGAHIFVVRPQKILPEPVRRYIANDFAKRLVRHTPPDIGTEYRADTNSRAGILHERMMPHLRCSGILSRVSCFP